LPVCQACTRRTGALRKTYVSRNIGIVAISTNDADKYPDDAPEQLKAMAKDLELTFPVCYDESQETAKAYTAACTPDFSSSMPLNSWCTGGSWMIADRAMGSLSLVVIYAGQLMRCWRVNLLTPSRSLA
jgi:hypothetical protein